MNHNHIHMKFWIKELHSYGIYSGPNSERLEDMSYYDLRSYLVKAQLQRDLEVKQSMWF